MKILILNQAFYPDVVSTAQHASDLAKALTEAGHEVTVICSARGYDDPNIRFPEREVWNSVDIIRVRSTGLGKRSKWHRAVDFGSFMAKCAFRLFRLPRVDVMVAMTSPPLISFLSSLAVPRKARKLVFWSMDLNPDEAIAAGWLHEKSLTARVLSRMLLHSLQRASLIVVLDRFMRDRIQAKGISAEKVLIVPPWAQDDCVRFDPAGRQDFRDLNKLSGRFVVMYSGNHSPCHPLETLLQAAERLAENDNIAFCFVGGGSEFGKVKERAQKGGLRNVLCLPYQPIERLSASLSAADLHVVVMGDQFVGIVHPCKIYNVLAVKKPFLYIGPDESHVTDIIGQSNSYVSSHGDVDKVVANILLAMRNNAASSTGIELDKLFSKNRLVPQMISAIDHESAKGLANAGCEPCPSDQRAESDSV
ncbi:MAG: glycosyltransferase WbuB [Candidatus Sulfotelmatobacter sp.]|nr:glycosyltransferase WbuB [Candidatus Sulfotelmatobacter sp.]